MAEWKKIIVSGSQAELAAVTASLGIVVGDNQITTSNFSGSFIGDGSGLTNIVAPGTISGSSQIDHDQTTNFVANEHIDHSSVDLSAGDGLTGGGNITTSRTFAVGEGTGITVSANAVSTNDSEIVHDNLSGFVANEHIDHSSVSITAGAGLTGGGDITETRALSVDSGSLLPFISSSVFGTISGDITITDGGVATLQPNSITLGTDTTGDYVQSLGSGTGVTIGSNSGEGSNPTISVDYGSSANQAVQGNTEITINGTNNEIEITGTANQALGGGPTYTVGLPDNVSVTSNLTVGGDLFVQGTTTTVNTTNLLVEDKFILLNSGSANPDEAGLVVDEGSAAGHAFVFDSNTTRWAFTGSLASDATSVAPDAFVAAVIDENVAESSDKAEYQKPGNIRVTAGGDIFIYV